MVEDVDISIILRERLCEIGFRQTLRQIGELGLCYDRTGDLAVIRDESRVIDGFQQRRLAVSLFADNDGLVSGQERKREVFDKGSPVRRSEA